ncbi:MAG: radical SAM protein [Acetobacteraceae bacterium]|nr:radical SAM protein [Pseudomonadota bacterium]
MNDTIDIPVPGNTPVKAPAQTTSGSLRAPLYVAWQLTNECNLACLHCIEESGPGKAFHDEMTKEQVFNVLRQIAEEEVPYLSFSGGEPMLHPHFFEMVEYICDRGVELKIETNAHYLTPEACRTLKDYGVKAVQVSLDGTTPASFNRMRVRGDYHKTIEGMRNLQAAGVPLEINFSPTSFNAHEIPEAIDIGLSVGAISFYTGRTMYTGNAVKTWPKINPTEDQYTDLFALLRQREEQHRDTMRIHFHEMGLLEELRYRLHNPAALIIVLPNGLVKLINALPFVCGDLRKQSLTEVWSHFQEAWQDPRVADFVDQLAADPNATSKLHKWVFL